VSQFIGDHSPQSTLLAHDGSLHSYKAFVVIGSL